MRAGWAEVGYDLPHTIQLGVTAPNCYPLYIMMNYMFVIKSRSRLQLSEQLHVLNMNDTCQY